MMARETWVIHQEIGCAGGVGVAAMYREGIPGELHVMLTGTFESFSHIGSTFIGKNAQREAVVFGNAIFAALEIAQTTWGVKSEECDT